ncbi:hypothetical protein, partial [Phaeobacter sp. 11ANDIMAR09]|uniref:hypothetical protein n=1 Tax=Phaeobacter sp. 11ANDIMAR09 TaxID=1225647 RepID=UPI0006C8C128
NADGALSDFIETMPEGQGRRWFETNKDLVVSVFSEAGHSNLRVLRQCLHDCGRVIDVLEEDLLASTGAMARFVQTFFALSMALSVGEISAKHLSERDNYENTLAPKEGEKPHPLRVCIDRHSHAEIFAGESSSIIPVGLGLSLIGIGYETPKKVNQILRSTGQFTGELEVPLWRRFVEWRKMPTAELEETYTEALSYLFESDVIQAGPYLHIANDIVTIENNESSNESKLQDKIVDRISSLAKTGKSPLLTTVANLAGISAEVTFHLEDFHTS